MNADYTDPRFVADLRYELGAVVYDMEERLERSFTPQEIEAILDDLVEACKTGGIKGAKERQDALLKELAK